MVEAVAECPHCSGTGWRESQEGSGVLPCECRARLRLERALEAARIPPRYRRCEFPGLDIGWSAKGGRRNETLWAAIQFAKAYCDEYPLKREEGKGLLLMGGPGVGKTHLVVALLKELIARGADGLFVDYQELLKQIQASYDTTARTAERHVMGPVLETEIVVIDDLGANRISDWVEDTINYLLNHRYSNRKPTLLTSNLSEGEFEDRLGIRVASRLREMCRLIWIDAEDYRKQMRV